MNRARHNSTIRSTAIVVALFLTLFKVPAFGSNAEPSTSTYVAEGYDVVSYFRDTGPVEGSTEFLVEHEDLTLIFSSEKNLLDFQKDPQAYIPAFNGNCAYGMVYGMESKSDPLEYDIVDNRVYLQLNAGTRNRWNRRVARNIKKANRVWKKLASSSK